MKRLVSYLAVSFLMASAIACGGSAKGACEHAKDLCKEVPGAAEEIGDCDAFQKQYDALTDDQKKLADTVLDCIDKASTCDGAAICAGAE